MLKWWEDILWRTQIVSLDRANVEGVLILFFHLTLAVQERVALQRHGEALVVDHGRLLMNDEVGEVKDGAISLILERVETSLYGFGLHNALDWHRVLVDSILDHLRSVLVPGLWIFSLLLIDSNLSFLDMTKHSVE